MKKLGRILGITATLLLAGLIRPLPAQAILFDAADVIEQGHFNVGGGAEILLSNPSSEGIEARVKYGLSSNFNAEAILGTGSNYRRFRLGLADTFSIFPDADGQLGVSIVSGALYLRRYDHATFQMSAGPMLNKKLTDWSVPTNLFFGLPFLIELERGRYYTGSTVTLGAILEWPSFEIPIEVGLGIGRSESYVATGVMVRL